MSRTTSILLLLPLLAGISSCKVVHSLAELQRKKAKVYTYHLKDKEVHFIPMHHLGKKAFYDDVTNKVQAHKKDGYVVFYEMISSTFPGDSATRDTIRRKARKMKGFSGTYKDMANEANVLKKYIQQPAYAKMGTTESDVRADVDYLQLVNHTEDMYGPIELDSTDMNTPFNVKYSNTPALTKQQHNNIIIDYRNAELLKRMKASDSKKILVLYGAGHRKNLNSQIKRANKVK